MQRRKPLGHLRAKQREGGHPAERGQVARPGIVANERPRAIRQREQFGDRARRGHVLFPGRQPPIPLVRIAGDLHAIMLAGAAGRPGLRYRSSGQTRTGWPAPVCTRISPSGRKCGSASASRAGMSKPSARAMTRQFS